MEKIVLEMTKLIASKESSLQTKEQEVYHMFEKVEATKAW